MQAEYENDDDEMEDSCSVGRVLLGSALGLVDLHIREEERYNRRGGGWGTRKRLRCGPAPELQFKLSSSP